MILILTRLLLLFQIITPAPDTTETVFFGQFTADTPTFARFTMTSCDEQWQGDYHYETHTIEAPITGEYMIEMFFYHEAESDGAIALYHPDSPFNPDDPAGCIAVHDDDEYDLSPTLILELEADRPYTLVVTQFNRIGGFFTREQLYAIYGMRITGADKVSVSNPNE